MPEIPFPDPPLRTGGIILRPWRESDVPAIVAACNDPSIPRWNLLIPSPYTEADAVTWLATHEPDRLAGRDIALALADVDSDTAIGAIGGRVDWLNLTGSIGYWLAPGARGEGHMTTAAKLLCAWMFKTLELGRIELTTDPENVASQAVATRCGFQQEGYLRSHRRFPHTGRRRDSLIWGLLPDDRASR
jgi:RimJ/RimL family protein N-acetyltransferase